MLLQALLAFVAITGGDNLGCGLTAAGEAYCWGNNEYGQVGSPPPEGCAAAECAYRPRRVPAGVELTRIDAGGEHVCALARDGAAYCWGSNITGALGTAASLDPCGGAPVLPGLVPGCSQRPVPVDGGLTFTAITAAPFFSCGLATSGDVYCWGMSGSGTDRVIHRAPRKLAGDGPYYSVSAGGYGVCAVDARGRLSCWQRWDSPAPEIVPAPEPFASVSVGWWHACALTPAGTAYCWGDNSFAQVGTGRAPVARERVPTPTPVAGLRRFREIFAGSARTCALGFDDALFCWGEDPGAPATGDCFRAGSLAPCTPRPVRVTEHRFRSVALGMIHSCAVTTEGMGYCWGRNYSGGWGDGRTGVVADTPVPVEWRG